MIEPGLLRVFRYFSALAVVYFAVLLSYSGIKLIPNALTYQIQTYLNLATYLALFWYLSSSWMKRKLGKAYLPLALGTATFLPIFSNLIYLADPAIKELSLLISRSWLLVPILLIPVTLTAWQYPYRYVVLLVALSALIELAVLIPLVETINYETITILGVPIIRAFAFGIVGQIVSLLMDTQRQQRKDLLAANIQLSEHALTLEQLTRTRERNRLARELHDTLAHTLSGLSVTLEAIKLMVKEEDTEIIHLLDQGLTNTRTGLDETRRALKDLRSKPLEEVGLLIALRNLADDAAARGSFRLEKELPAQLPFFPPEIEQSIYRIAQETFQNTIQHANAASVRFQITVQDSRFKMNISDDGEGFDSLEPQTGVFGLHGMGERASMIGGKLNVTSSPGIGTHIEFSIKVYDD